FKSVSRYPEELLATDLAAVDSRGLKSQTVVAPRQLFFVPAANLGFRSEEHDVRDDFLSIAEGTVLYRIHALPSKYASFNYAEYTDEKVARFLAVSEHVADIVTTSRFVASEFGDDGIFFKHQLRP